MNEDILVVDNDISSRDTFYEVFSSMGYRVTCVPNGKEAALRLEKVRPALIILDSEIPQSHLDCFQTIDKIKEFDADINFVILSKEDMPPQTKERIFSTGALAIIKKDFSTHLMMKEILGILKESIHGSKRETRSGKILIVDDEFEIRDMIGNFLTNKGYTVTLASSGEDALLNLRQDKPQLVLCDIRMPGMDGLMLLKKIKAMDPSIKVVMLTAIQDEDVIAGAHKEGAEDYLLKPFTLMKLDALVLAILPK